MQMVKFTKQLSGKKSEFCLAVRNNHMYINNPNFIGYVKIQLTRQTLKPW